MMSSVTQLLAQHAPNLSTDNYQKPYDASVSDLSKSTLVTQLGKRSRKASGDSGHPAIDAKNIDSLIKRAKQDACETGNVKVLRKSSNNNVIQIRCPQALERAVKSAPTSNNGSTTLNPVLDIQVSLPDGEIVSEDDNMEGLDRKERR